MSAGRSPELFLRITSRTYQIVPGMTVHGYSALAALLLWAEDDPPHFQSFRFHLDTKSDVTTIPESWIADHRRRFGPLSRLITATAQSAAGTVPINGRIVRGVRFRFYGEIDEARMDVLVSSNLKTPYGLLSLRDLHNHYLVKSEGPFRLDNGHPVALGILRLHRRPPQ